MACCTVCCRTQSWSSVNGGLAGDCREVLPVSELSWMCKRSSREGVPSSDNMESSSLVLLLPETLLRLAGVASWIHKARDLAPEGKGGEPH